MTHFHKKTVMLFAVVLMVLTMLPIKAFASDAIDQEETVSLTIHYKHEDTPVSDVEFLVYHVAEITAPEQFAVTEAFRAYPVRFKNLDTADWRGLAQTLTHYAQADHITPVDRVFTDEQGVATFPNGGTAFKPGLYLVSGQPKTEGTHTYFTEPFLICLPVWNQAAAAWEYDYAVSVKHAAQENQTSPGSATVQRSVRKIWQKDTKAVRPAKVTVELLRNGVFYDFVELHAETNWRYTWDTLPKYDERGVPIQWGLAERNVSQYTVSVTLEGDTFILTNTYTGNVKPPAAGPSLPNTGVLWWPVPVCAALGLIFLIASRILKGRQEDE